MTITGIEHSATNIGKQVWGVKKKKIMEGIAMKYQPKKTLENADKEAEKAEKIHQEVRAIEEEIGATKDPKKKRSLQEQLEALKKIRDRNKKKKT